MQLKKILLLTATLSFFLAALASAEDEIPVYEFPEAFRVGLEKSGSFARQRMSDALFDSIDSLKVVEISKERMSVGLRIGRSVYNNFDVAQSYTVVDTLRIPVTLYSYSVPVGNTHFALTFGIGGAFEMRNIRQVARNNWKKLERMEERAEGVEATDWFKEADPNFANPENPPYTEIPKKDSNPLFQLDSLNYARYSKFWNQLSFPARLPLKAEWIDRMDVGEIVTYGGEGFAEFGPSFGVFKNLPEFDDVIRGMGLSADYKLFIRGEYRIVILREDEFHAKVKVLRRDETGRKMGIGAESQKTYLFDGFALFGKEMKFFGVNLVPFNFQKVNSKGDVIEQGFRFDLRDEEAREAYDLAVIGRFARADEVAMRLEAEGVKEGAVQRIFHRDADEEYERSSRSLKIFLYNQDRSSESRSSDAKIILKDGEHKVYSAVVENRFESKMFLGSRERSVNRVTIDFADEVLGVILEAWIEDSETDGTELERYTGLVESLIRRGKIFPEFPTYGPETTEVGAHNRDVQSRAAFEYGPSAFYFRMDADAQEVERFIRTPDDEKWKILEIAFGVEQGRWDSAIKRGAHRVMSYLGKIINLFFIPFDLRLKDIEALYVADSIFENWADIGEETDPYKLTKLLAQQFADRVYGFEMMHVFTLALEAERVPFYLSANNLAFGRINVQDGHFGNAGKTLEEYRREANLENPEIGHNIDLVIQDFSVEVLNETQVELRFVANARPHMVYFRIDEKGFFPSTEKEIVVLNTGWAEKGENRIVLDKNGVGFTKVLADALSEPSEYEILLGLGARDRTWGPVVVKKFYHPYKAPERPAPAPDAN